MGDQRGGIFFVAELGGGAQNVYSICPNSPTRVVGCILISLKMFGSSIRIPNIPLELATKRILFSAKKLKSSIEMMMILLEPKPKRILVSLKKSGSSIHLLEFYTPANPPFRKHPSAQPEKMYNISQFCIFLAHKCIKVKKYSKKSIFMLDKCIIKQ